MILVTGAAGYVGAHILLALLDRGIPVLALDSLITGDRRQVPDGICFIEGDCGDRVLVEQLVRTHGVDLVIHCAGLISVTESVEQPLRYYAANVASALALVEAAAAGGARRIVFSSTATVYGAPDAALLGEDLPLAPVNPYAASKAMVERMLADAAAAGLLQVAVLRYFNVAGADPAGRAGQVSRVSTHIVKIAAEAAVGRRDHVALTGTDYPTPDGTGIRDYIHVSDLADAHLAAVDALRAGARHLVLNVGYGRGASVNDVLDALDRVTGSAVRRVPAPRRPGDVARLVADTARIRNILGWTPRHDDLDRIVADAVAWERRLIDHSNLS